MPSPDLDIHLGILNQRNRAGTAHPHSLKTTPREPSPGDDPQLQPAAAASIAKRGEPPASANGSKTSPARVNGNVDGKLPFGKLIRFRISLLAAWHNGFGRRSLVDCSRRALVAYTLVQTRTGRPILRCRRKCSNSPPVVTSLAPNHTAARVSRSRRATDAIEATADD